MKRVLAHMVTLVCIMQSLIYSISMNKSLGYILWCIPNLFSSLSIFVFLFMALLKKPKAVNESFICFFIGIISSNLPFLVGTFGDMFSMGVKDESLIILAILINLLTMPFYITGVFTLGKRLTVLPEANSLQTSGIYSISRHPLYLCYLIWFVTQIMIFQTWMVVILSIIQITLIIIRAKSEERILEKNFPEYKEYKSRVWWIGNNSKVLTE